jgi:hypothetical protein
MGLQEVCDALSASLGISFDSRESDFKGGRYYLARAQGFGKVTIEVNWEDDEGYLAEPDFPKCSTLVYASDPTARMLSVLENAGYLQCLRVECVD